MNDVHKVPETAFFSHVIDFVFLCEDQAFSPENLQELFEANADLVCSATVCRAECPLFRKLTAFD
jgi:hypothetical protein